MYKKDLALNNLLWLIYHKNKPKLCLEEYPWSSGQRAGLQARSNSDGLLRSLSENALGKGMKPLSPSYLLNICASSRIAFYRSGFLNYVFIFIVIFGRYVHRPSSGVCRTREPTQNFEPRPLFKPRWTLVLIPLTITWYKC